jgi:hypothetical protein
MLVLESKHRLEEGGKAGGYGEREEEKETGNNY